MSGLRVVRVEPTRSAGVLKELALASAGNGWIWLQPADGDGEPAVAASKLPDGPGIILAGGGSQGGRSLCLHPLAHLDHSAAATGRWLEACDIDPSQALVLNPLPLHHMSGLMPWWRSHLWGAEHVLLPLPLMRDPQRLLAHCRLIRDWDCRPMVVSLVPTQLRRLLAHDQGVCWLQRFAVVWVGGAALPKDLADHCRRLGVRLSPCYGATETAAMVAALSPEQFLAGESGCGAPLDDVELCLDATGALMVRTARLAIGRWCEGGLQPLTDADGWWCSGDAAILRCNADGFRQLRIQGRLDGAIHSGGETVFPEQLAQRLLIDAHKRQLPLEAVLFLPVEQVEWGQRLVALVRCHEGVATEPDWPSLQLELQQLSRHWRPAERPIAWHQCQELEPTAAGKWQQSRWQAWLRLQECAQLNVQK
ncbi:AMP-binding protein [Synechococcus sp. UW140]|uniref:AMP-binding protein n=1 Tax=Synechococcus sp. UW140 TaxID=368503 RepID=UPI000E0F97C8|nr:AMP-binding protein [Synechococcus sp. UW140]